MIDGSEKRNRQLAFELQNSHVCEKRSKFERTQASTFDPQKNGSFLFVYLLLLFFFAAAPTATNIVPS